MAKPYNRATRYKRIWRRPYPNLNRRRFVGTKTAAVVASTQKTHVQII